MERLVGIGIMGGVIGPVQRRRRWFGVLFLIIAGAMLIWGLTFLKPLLVGISFVVYWLVCLVMTLAAFVVGYADLRAVRREQRRQLNELMKSTLDTVRQDRNR
ncbi:MAG TPA: phage holin family protein [Verrucomicrobiota bacterium]|nr:phage holin family protein [Verrucomicrobiota bacterium]